ncbi:MAG: NAD-dependent epimerase/dehydratase family protein [Rhizobiales bacterium]|nr:NAD-dependent epimerase/dehydratase family protein [Hyphomicrobiales bacterium]
MPTSSACRAEPRGMRILVIGANGFMGRHLLAAIRARFDAGTELRATARLPEAGFASLDITDDAATRAMLRDLAPTHVVNLAGIAAPAAAGRDPDAAWQVHLHAVRKLGAAMLEIVPDAQLINTGTGLVYGASFRSGDALDEAALLSPLDDYAASKAAGDLALGALAQRGLRVVIMRPFNQAGAGQSEDFVLPAFAAQIARIEAGKAAPVMSVGNLDAERDFLDVRDVAAAYIAAIERPAALAPGTILNLASGTPRRIGDILDALLRLSPAAIRVAPDPARLRPSDIPRALGDAGRARALLHWTPAIPFGETLRTVLEDHRRHFRV